MKRTGTRLGSLVGMLLLLAGLCSPGVTRAAAGDPVLEWNVIMRTTVTPSNAFMQVRAAAIMHLAMFEAVNAISGGYAPYTGQLAVQPGASADAAANAAAHRVLVSLYPSSEGSLNTALSQALAAIPDGPAKTSGIAIGVSAANALVALRANDGAAEAGGPDYFGGTDPGEWQPTPGVLKGAFPSWGKVVPFGIQSGAQFRSNPPPALHTGQYARDYNEVKAYGALNSAVRSQEQTDRARYFGGNLPLHVFNEAARQVSLAQGTALAENARIFALLNMALTDGLISSMEAKYYYGYWRPYTAIRNGDVDDNKLTAQDGAWEALAFTPPYPSYPSNYASAAFAATRVLETSFGDAGHAITLPSINLAVNITLHYSSFGQLSADINDARVHGGMHFRFDQDAGSKMGRQVGSYILKHELQPAHGDS